MTHPASPDGPADPLEAGSARPPLHGLDRDALVAEVLSHRALFDNALNGIAHCRMIFDGDRPVDFEYLQVNAAFSRQTGLRDATGRRVTELIPGIRESDPELFEIYGRVARSGLPERFERYVEALQDWYSVSVYSPAPDCFVAAFDVISERKRREAELLQTHDRLALAQRASGSGLWDWDLLTGELTWTDELFRLFGLDPKTTSASFDTWRSVVHPDDLAAAEARVQRAVDECGSLTNEYRIRLPDGSVCWIDARGEVLAGAQGQPVRMLGLCIDASRRKADEAELEKHRSHLEDIVAARTVALAEARDAADAASRAKSVFLTHMSHEIRTPMNGVLGMAELLRRTPLDARQVSFLDKIERSAQHLLSLINDILELSKIEAGRVVVEEQPFGVDELLSGLLAVVGESARAKGLALVVDAGDLPPVLLGDKTRLSQALVNFLGNAIKFTPRGSVSLRAKVLARSAHDCLVRFEVSDTGIGLSREEQSRLFVAFEQADKSISRRFGGTGLGLAITKRIVALLGGEVGVDSMAGLGSSFWMTARLRLGPEAPAPRAGHDDREQALRVRHQGKAVLVADDDPVNQEVLLCLLRGVGLNPRVASQGAQALALCRDQDFALVLMDVQMPELDGLAATRAIRAIERHRRTPIVAITANAFDDDRAQCLEAGMDDFLTKPLAPAQLFGTLLRWLDAGGENRPSDEEGSDR